MNDFPLIVAEDEKMKICPECGFTCGGEDENCENCGCDLSEVEAEYDEILMSQRVEEMEEFAEKINSIQDFYEVTVESGYYSGVQFYVEGKYWKLEDWDSDEIKDEFDLRRRTVLRRQNAACKRVQNELNRAKKELGLIQLGVFARFSNGETWYSKVA